MFYEHSLVFFVYMILKLSEMFPNIIYSVPAVKELKIIIQKITISEMGYRFIKVLMRIVTWYFRSNNFCVSSL